MTNQWWSGYARKWETCVHDRR